ncbi:RNA processing protein [Orbilia oligospora]|nr:RNA processing protein [Orbilia oligospora]KAF3115630.1 RNA processing protein [Orbilia oligospora]KAF3123854.1 RNA processing protein [Orbilia oligospora]
MQKETPNPSTNAYTKLPTHATTTNIIIISNPILQLHPKHPSTSEGSQYLHFYPSNTRVYCHPLISSTMLPLTLLTTVQGHPLLVELKNGETLNGHLVSCDTWMNLTLKEVIQTSPDGETFHRLPEAYVRGNNIKYLRVPDEIIDIVKEQQAQQAASGDHHRSGGGDRGGGNRRGGGGAGGRGDHRGDRGRGSGRGEFRGRGGGGRGGRGRGN